MLMCLDTGRTTTEGISIGNIFLRYSYNSISALKMPYFQRVSSLNQDLLKK